MKSTSLLLVPVALALAACSATLSKDECRNVDWRTVGYEDGVAGRSPQRIGEHRKACAEYGIKPDLDAYQAGRAQGLREFCQPHNGYRAGVSGQPYYDGCPPELEAAFLTEYDAGRKLYLLERRVSDADEQIAYNRAEIARLEGRATGSAFEALNEAATPEARTTAVLDAKQSAERIGRLKAETKQLEKDRVLYAQELEAYRRSVPPR